VDKKIIGSGVLEPKNPLVLGLVQQAKQLHFEKYKDSDSA